MDPEPVLPAPQGDDIIDVVNIVGSRRSSDTVIACENTDGRKSSETVVDEEEEDQSDVSLTNLSRRDKTILWCGIALMWIMFELDHTTVYNYQQYAASEFGEISALGALLTAGTIIVAVMKPPIAKISDIAGRAETYMGIVVVFVVSYILLASSHSFAQYAGGYVIYSLAQTGLQILNQIMVAQITSSRWRGLANGLINLPFMIIPWISAFIVESALKAIGWRWGIGLYAIILPVVSLGIIVPLLLFRRRSIKAGYVTSRKPTTIRGFFSGIDLGGTIFLTAGWAMLLIPVALAGSTGANSNASYTGWKQPWVITLLILGGLCIIAFHCYEKWYAGNPVMPPRYFRNRSLVIACILGLLDAFAFNITHTYMYAWSTVVHHFSARNATFLTYTAGCFQVFSGLTTGFVMYRSRRYKWLVVIGVCVRLIGYGIMIRLRGTNNSVAELFIVQAIQGLGSGIVGTVVLVVAQIVVSQSELAQATALILLFIFLGQAIGAAVAGSIYTTLFKPRLHIHLSFSADQRTIDEVFSSITGRLPRTGSSEREAINNAYSDILRYMTIGAIAASAIPFLLCWFLPNLQLSDKHNLAKELEKKGNDGGQKNSDQKDERILATTEAESSDVCPERHRRSL